MIIIWTVLNNLLNINQYQAFSDYEIIWPVDVSQAYYVNRS